ncbi:MAG TPA: hypothetical protein PLZ84_00040 [Clostridia bacterium]|mgnify:CR=1 FL=1|nr:hypothetical protein [Clostridia bacterium]
MKSIVKLIVAAAAVYFTFFFVSYLKNMPRPGANNGSTAALTPTPSGYIYEYEVPDDYILTDIFCDMLLRENDLELVVNNSEENFPISDTDIKISDDGTISFAFNLKVDDAIKRYKVPLFVKKIVDLGIIKGDVPLYFKGTVQANYGSIQYFPQDIRVGNMSLKTIENLIGMDILNDQNNIRETNKLINDVVLKELKLKVSSLDYGNGFIRVKGRAYKNVNEE